MLYYPFEMQPLKFGYNDLEPIIDEETLYIHYNFHYGKYVNNLNEIISKYPRLQKASLEYMLSNPFKLPCNCKEAILNNGGGIINHQLYFDSMTNENTKSCILEKIDDCFNSYDEFKKLFIQKAMEVFGSGYVMLGADKRGKLRICQLKNQQTYISKGIAPIITMDVWEHSYYLKYKNNKKEYVENWMDLIDFEYAYKNYIKYCKKG